MPEMHWIHYADAGQRTEETLVDDNLLCQGKIVFLRHSWLTGEEPTGKVTALTRWEDPTNYFKRVLQRLHIKQVGEPSVHKVKRTKGYVESTTGWSVGALNPARFAAYHFEDGFDHRSHPVWVSDSSRKMISTSAEAGLAATVHGIGGKLGFGRGTVRVWTCNKDPELSLEFMLPWQSDTHDLRAFAAKYLGYLAPYLDVEEALEAGSDGYLPRDKPADWGFSLEPNSISLDEGGEATVAVTVSAPTPGKAAFAVRVVEQGNPDNFVVSPIVEVEQTEEGAEEEARRLQEEAATERVRSQHEIAAKTQAQLKVKLLQHPPPKPK
jgi:hypothetical protein